MSENVTLVFFFFKAIGETDARPVQRSDSVLAR